MATIQFGKLGDYELKLSRLADGAADIAGKAIYSGAEIIADKIKENLNALNTSTQQLAMQAARNKKPAYITDTAKEGLIQSFGVSKMQKDADGIYNVKVGFDGYNSVKTSAYPNGQPNQLIARACESGSSAMIKQPFMRKAVNASKKAAEAKMAEIIDKELKKLEG